MDEEARELERRANAGDPVAEAKLLAHRVRRGELAIARVRLAAFLGYAAAADAGGTEDAERLADPELDYLEPCGQQASARVALAAAQHLRALLPPRRRRHIRRDEAFADVVAWIVDPRDERQRDLLPHAVELAIDLRRCVRGPVARREQELTNLVHKAVCAAAATDERDAAGAVPCIEHEYVSPNGESRRSTVRLTADYRAAKAAVEALECAAQACRGLEVPVESIAIAVREAVVPWLLGVPRERVVATQPLANAPVLALIPPPRTPPPVVRKRIAKERRDLERYFFELVAAGLAPLGFAPHGPKRDEFRRRRPESEERIRVSLTYSKYREEGGTSPSVSVDLATVFPELEPSAELLRLDGFRNTPGCSSGLRRVGPNIGVTRERIAASLPFVLQDVERELAWFDTHATLAGLERDHRSRPIPRRSYALETLAALLAARGRRDELEALLPLLEEGFRARLAAAFPAP